MVSWCEGLVVNEDKTKNVGKCKKYSFIFGFKASIEGLIEGYYTRSKILNFQNYLFWGFFCWIYFYVTVCNELSWRNLSEWIKNLSKL